MSQNIQTEGQKPQRVSRVGKKPIPLGKVVAKIEGQDITIEGPKGTLHYQAHKDVNVSLVDGELWVKTELSTKSAMTHTGTTRSLLANMVKGVSSGYSIKLTLKGVGYRAQLVGKNLQFALGFSHPVIHEFAEGVKVDLPSQTEIILHGIDKQVLHLEAARLRNYRPPEAYKNKGVHIEGKVEIKKESKKKAKS